MKVGDLVIAQQSGYVYESDVVQEDWVGIIIHFTQTYFNGKKYRLPVVYWNQNFNAEIEDPAQLELLR